MGHDTFAHLVLIQAHRTRFAELRAELRQTSDHEDRALIFDEAVATLNRIRDLESQRG